MKTKIPSLFAIAGAAALLIGLSGGLPAGAQEGIAIPPPKLDQTSASGHQIAVLAGGCFWGVQGVFQHVQGVDNAVSGYAGGDAKTATYRAVVSGRTGHAEAVQVTFDPNVISYGEILQIYFSVAHDPTQLNRQGPDRGTQYRSAIFPQNAEQAQIASAYIDQLNAAKTYRSAIVTTIETPHPTLYRHQRPAQGGQPQAAFFRAFSEHAKAGCSFRELKKIAKSPLASLFIQSADFSVLCYFCRTQTIAIHR